MKAKATGVAIPIVLYAQDCADACRSTLGAPPCGSRWQGWTCTRSKGHGGTHVAGGGAIYAAWT